MMAVLSDKQRNDDFKLDIFEDASVLREERRNTGRFIASATAIFLCVLGLYEALARGTPQYAALFVPAVIMFVYVMWILYASKKYARRKRELELLWISRNISRRLAEKQMKLNNNTPPIPPPPPLPPPPSPPSELKDPTNFVEKEHTFCRTYSVA